MTTLSKEDVVRMAEEAGYWNGQTCEMNDVGLQHFAALARADLVAENERLRKALRLFRDNLLFRIGSASPYRKIAHEYYEYIWPMTTQPRDDSALRRLLAEAKAGVYEECARIVDAMFCDYSAIHTLADASAELRLRTFAEKAKEEKC